MAGNRRSPQRPSKCRLCSSKTRVRSFRETELSSGAAAAGETPASVSLAHCLWRKTQGLPRALRPRRTPSTPVCRTRSTTSGMDLRSPLPRIRVGDSRASSTARPMASQSAAPRYICFRVRPWREMAAGPSPRSTGIHPSTSTSSYPTRVLTDSGIEGRPAGAVRPRFMRRTLSTTSGARPTSSSRCPAAQSASPWRAERMRATASSGLRMRPAPHPLAATFLAGHPMLMSSPSNPSSPTTCATW